MESLKELCKKRLILDWKPLNSLRQKYHAFVECLQTNGNDNEETKAKYREVLLELEVYKFEMRLSEAQTKRTGKEMEDAKEEIEQIDSSLSTLEKEYDTLLDKFSQEKRLHDQRMEYDSMATAILKLEDPEKQTKKLEQLKKECQLLEGINVQLEEKIKKKMKDFSLVFHAMKLLEDDS